MPRSWSTSFLRSLGACRLKAVSCFCSANTDARNAASSMPRMECTYVRVSVIPSATWSRSAWASAFTVLLTPVIVRRTR
jgi:hypothetical protein